MTTLLKIPTISTDKKLVPANPGTPGVLMMVPLGKLLIDTKYQRPVGERGARNIRQIIENFSWACYSPLVVSRRGEKFAVIDGQHRAIAAVTHGGIKEVPCLVITDATPEIEAKAFTIINGHVTSMMESHLFYARVAAKDPSALATLKACEAANVKILKMPTQAYKVGETLSVMTLERCLKKFGHDTLVTSLQTITETGNGNPGFVRAPIFHGTCEVLTESPYWRDAGEKLFKAIEKVGIPGLYTMAMREQAQVGGGLRLIYAKHLRVTLQRELGRKAA